MEAYYKLKEQMERALDKLAAKGDLSTSDLELAHKLTDTVKNIDKICMLEEDGSYSRDGSWRAHMEGDYGRGSSYANRGQHYVRGHYSRDGGNEGMSQRGYSRNGNYSRGGIRDSLADLMQDAGSEKEREAIRRCMDAL